MNQFIPHSTVSVNEKEFPVLVGFFPKKNSSGKIKDGAIYLRISNRLSKYQKNVHIEHLIDKITKHSPIPPNKWNPLEHLFKKEYFTEIHETHNIHVGNIQLNNDKVYNVYFVIRPYRELSCKLRSGAIYVYVPSKDLIAHKHKEIELLLYKLLAKTEISYIKDVVYDLNNTFFHETIQDIRLKNTSTRWGSCSTKKNINLSVKLLFVPYELLEYVAIHELAHLKEMNHSPRFWAHVESALPDYKEKKRLLKSYE